MQDLSLLIPTTEPSSLPLLARIWWYEQRGSDCLDDDSSAASLRSCGRAALALGDLPSLYRSRQRHDILLQTEEEVAWDNYDSDQESYEDRWDRRCYR